jgi:hypothetical protein
MPSETGITSILGIEKEINKDQPGGYAGLDASGYVPADEIGNISLIPIAVYVDAADIYGIPFIDDAPTFSNLIFVASGHHIEFDSSLHCFNMRKT